MASFKNTGLTIDGVFYDVLIQFESMSFVTEPIIISSAESINGVIEQKRIGTRFNYQLTIDPKTGHQSDYDSLVSLLSDPTNPEHSFSFPHENSTLTFNGIISRSEDVFRGIWNGAVVWGTMRLEIIPTDPQVTI